MAVESAPGVRNFRADRFIAAGIVLASASLYLWKSSITDLSGDELWTRSLMRLPLEQTWPFILADGKHPPFYTFLQIFLANFLPDTVLGLRVVSLAAAALIPAVVFRFARSLRVTLPLALVLALWIGTHPLVVWQATNARSYPLMALLVTLYAGTLVKYLMVGDRRALALAGIVAVSTVLTHAFGVLFVGGIVVGGITWLAIQPSTRSGSSIRALLLSTLPSLALIMTWYGLVVLSPESSGGLSEGLGWVETPIPAERGYNFAALLGAPTHLRHAVSTTVLMWGCAGLALLIAVRRQPVQLWSIVMVVGAAFMPFAIQNLASGLVVDLPLWGTRHVVPTPGILAIGLALSLQPSLLPRWWQVTMGWLLFALSAAAISGSDRWHDTVFSDTAELYKTFQSPTAIRVMYPYGDVNVMNFYLDRGCVDSYQLRTVYPGVAGPGSALSRADRCVARHISDLVPSTAEQLIIISRAFVPSEVALRDSVLSTDWMLVRRLPTSSDQRVIELLTRAK